MDLSTDMPMVGFFIYRSGEQSDPTTSLEFCPSKDSDELFFALKMAYPLVKTHSERMRNAVIEFLIKERDEEQTRNQMAAPVVPMIPTLSHEGSAESPWSSWPSMASNSTLSSPDLVDLATPASMSPHISQGETMSRQASQAQSSTASTNTPALEQMTGVFSLSSIPQPKTRVRRKMTESEKAEYRKRRIVKACDSCSKRKRKCNHNAVQLEKVASTSKVTKAKTSAPSTTASVARNEQLERAVFHHVDHSEFSNDPFAFLDEHMLSELPTVDDHAWLSNMNFDNLFAPKAAPLRAQAPATATAWPWSDTPDWKLLDTPQQTNTSLSPSYTIPLFPSSAGLHSPSQIPILQLDNEIPQQTHHQSEIEQTALRSPTRSWRNFSDFSRTAFSAADGRDGQEMPLFHSSNAQAKGDTVSSSSLRPLFSNSEILTGPQSSIAAGFTGHESALLTPRSNTEATDHGISSEGSSSSKKKQSSKSGDTLKQHLKSVRDVEQTAASTLIEQTKDHHAQGTSSSDSEGGHARTAVNAELRTTNLASQARSNDQGQLPLPRQRVLGAGRALSSDSIQGASEFTAGSRSPTSTTSSSDIATSALRDTVTAHRLKATRKRPATSDAARVPLTARSNQDHRLPSVETCLASLTSVARASQDAISSSGKETASSHQSGVPAQVSRSPVPVRASRPSQATTSATSSLTLPHDQKPAQPSRQTVKMSQSVVAQGDWQLETDKNPEPQRERQPGETRMLPMKSDARMTHGRLSIVAGCPNISAIDVALATYMEICAAGQTIVSVLVQAMLTQASVSTPSHVATTEKLFSGLSMLVAPV